MGILALLEFLFRDPVQRCILWVSVLILVFSTFRWKGKHVTNLGIRGVVGIQVHFTMQPGQEIFLGPAARHGDALCSPGVVRRRIANNCAHRITTGNGIRQRLDQNARGAFTSAKPRGRNVVREAFPFGGQCARGEKVRSCKKAGCKTVKRADSRHTPSCRAQSIDWAR